jgi:hypothetical protein
VTPNNFFAKIINPNYSTEEYMKKKSASMFKTKSPKDDVQETIIHVEFDEISEQQEPHFKSHQQMSPFGVITPMKNGAIYS